MEKDTPIVEIINQTIDQNDPTQKAIGLLALLVESKINTMAEKMGTLRKELNEQKFSLDDLKNLKQCPIGLEAKIKEDRITIDKQIEKINAILQPLYFVDKYPKLAMLMVIGILTLCGLGLERVISFF